MTDYICTNREHIRTVSCNNCGFRGKETDLIKVLVTGKMSGKEKYEKYKGEFLADGTQEIIDGCPRCVTDNYLSHIFYITESEDGYWRDADPKHCEGWVKDIESAGGYFGYEIIDCDIELPSGNNVRWREII